MQRWLIVFLGCCFALPLYALPQFFLLTGNRCINCHVQAQGGGLRNELGWYSYSDVSLIDPEILGLARIFDLISETNSPFDGLLTLGFDFRLQSARKHNSPDAQRRTFPMQASLYAALNPTDWLTLEGGYNPGPQRYAGQQAWHASILIQPTVKYPQFRLGFFRPAIGMRYDDHTVLVSQIPTTIPQPLISPLYAEWGVQVTYESIKWLTVAAGAFSSQNLAAHQVQSESGTPIPLVDSSGINFLGKIVLWKHLRSLALISYIGSSIYTQHDFTLYNLFAGFGIEDLLAFWIEYAHSQKLGLRSTNALSAEILWEITEGLALYGRVETGGTLTTTNETPAKSYAQQMVIGAHIFVLPYIQLRPEYRLLDTDRYRSTRYAMQLYVFY